MCHGNSTGSGATRMHTVVLVVVKSDNLGAGVVGPQYGAEVLLHKLCLELGRPEALFPTHIASLGLVLDSHTPYVDAVLFVGGYEAGKVVGVRALHLGIETVGLRRREHRAHAVDWKFHPMWRRPRRGEE